MAKIAVKDIPQLYKRAMKLQAKGQLKEAHTIYNEIVAARPQTAEAHYQIGRIARKVKDFRVAVQALNQALKIKPGEVVVLRELAEVLGDAGQVEEGIRAFRELLKHLPRDVEAHVNMGILLQRSGNFEESDQVFRKALRISPGDGQVYRSWLQGKKVKKGEPIIKDMIASHADQTVQGRSRADLCFALAKAMEDTGQYEKVFRFLNEGNKLFSDVYPFSQKEFFDEIDQVLRVQNTFDWSNLKSELDNEAFAPIIVSGLPRSGTTLIEQILASHSKVVGGGETGILPVLLFRMLKNEKGTAFRDVLEFKDTQFEVFPRLYANELSKQVRFEKMLTDKTIANYRYIGMIKALIPNARIIVVRRDPRDQLLSMYKNVFAEGTYTASNNLEALAAYYEGFTRCIDFWREQAPDAFSEVSYEELVNDPEVQSRKLIAAAGLEWEDACLDFHKTKRDVKTLSIHQVRQPMYKSSAKAWERYADDLKPLTDALEQRGVLEWHYKT